MKKRTHEELTEALWPAFRDRLAAAQNMAHALTLLGEQPAENAPGRRFYSNLGFFLQGFTVPGGSSARERALYLAFVQRLDAAGALKPGVMVEVEARFGKEDLGP
jgi:hypothetical protein